jgi:hypothetical protein
VLTSCHPSKPLSSDEALVVGRWQCNPRNGAVWRITFSRDHTAVFSLPHDDSVDANKRDAKFDRSFKATWWIDGDQLVYADADQPTKEKAKIKLSEFKTATPFGSDPNAYLERM